MILIVNGERITSQQVQDEIKRLEPHYKSMFPDQNPEEQTGQLAEWARENLIESVLLKQAAINDSWEIPVEQVDTAFEKLKADHGGDEQFYQASGLTSRDDKYIKDDLAQQQRLERLIAELQAQASRPTEVETLAYYQANPDQFMLPEMVQAAHIVKHIEGFRTRVEAENEILELWSKMQEDHSFEELAGIDSDCADNSGDLGLFPRGQMVEEFDQVVFNLEPGTTSDVFETAFGFHIVKVYEHHPPQSVDYSDVQSQISEKLYEDRKTEQIESYVDSLKQNARITYRPYNGKPVKFLTSILIKPSGPDCNLDCDYCFYLEKVDLYQESKKHRMDEETLEILIRQAIQQSEGPLSFGWQGGEPTLMGLPFFQKAVEFQGKYGFGRKIGNGLQTNGILIDREWIGFLKEYNFLVGLSIDGAEHVHDKYRKFREGGKSWRKVVDKAELMLRSEVSINALSVVNDYSVHYPEETYNFLKSLGFQYMQFIPVVETDLNHPESAAPFSVNPTDFGNFLCRIFDLWRADFRDGVATTSVRHFDSVFHTYVGLDAPECTLLKQCGNYVVVEHNGDVYACDFFFEQDWRLGNLHDDDLLVMLNSDNQNKFGNLKADMHPDCQKCAWRWHCYGGCTKDRLRDPRDNGLSHFCSAYKKFFNHANQQLKQLAKEWEQAQTRTGEPVDTNKNTSSVKIKNGRNDPC
ncbi:MAG: anaerobic sulfatase maturase [Candidatus Marinimicrobia bacterium]|nr:anaerobic sulfatase maturase [Candidatus Neomarinimicrobiota bacterium]